MAFRCIDGNVIDDEGNYAYKNIELTPNVFANIMVYLFNHKQFKRHTAIDAIVEYHIDNGGISHLDNYTGAFKKVTKKSAISSYFENLGYGTWILNVNNDIDTIEIVEEKIDRQEPKIDEILGEGKGTVYVYYYDSYKEKAILKGQTIWECKVGRSNRNAIERIISQAGTAYPEHPHIAIKIKCSSAKDMEQALHAILKLNGRWISNAPGTEWYMTSPEEIKDLYNAITGIIIPVGVCQ